MFEVPCRSFVRIHAMLEASRIEQRFDGILKSRARHVDCDATHHCTVATPSFTLHCGADMPSDPRLFHEFGMIVGKLSKTVNPP